MAWVQAGGPRRRARPRSGRDDAAERRGVRSGARTLAPVAAYATDSLPPVHLSAKADYALRALAELAAAADRNVRAEDLAALQGVPREFLENILLELRYEGIVNSKRGSGGGWSLGRPASRISLADVIRATDGPLVTVRGECPENIAYSGAAEALQEAWVAARRSLRDVLEHVSLADVAAGRLPAAIDRLARDPASWIRR